MDPQAVEAEEALEHLDDPVYGKPASFSDGLHELPACSWFGCCPRLPRLLTERIHRHFQGLTTLCPTCGEPADVIRHFRSAAPPQGRADLRLVGERSTNANFPLGPKGVEIRLTELGIPDRATILELRYNSQLALHVINAVMTAHGIFDKYPHGGRVKEHVPFPPHHGVVEELAPFAGREQVPRVLRLCPQPPGEGEPADTVVKLDVRWIDIPAQQPEWQLLSSAFLAFADGMLPSAVMWASTAIESRMYGVLQFPFQEVASIDRVERFLTDEATFSAQLQVLLPFIVNVKSWPHPGTDLLGEINRLRKLRNAAAHKTHAELQLDAGEVSRLLGSAALMLHYLGLLASLDAKQTLTG